MVLVFGADVPMVGLVVGFGAVAVLIFVEAIVITILLLYNLKYAKALAVKLEAVPHRNAAKRSSEQEARRI